MHQIEATTRPGRPASRLLARLCAGALAAGIGAAGTTAYAAEAGFSAYGLGGQGFGAGVTPPPGFYVTPFLTYLSVETRNVTIGGAVTGKLNVDFVVMGLNLLYVPKVEILGGRLGIGMTLPFAHNTTKGSFTLGPLTAQRTVSDWGIGDISLRAQLGWTVGTFNHTAYVMGILPTGEYDTGFKPNIGLHRPGIDIGWGFTWEEKSLGIQLNGIAGVLFNFENTRTKYDTGTEFHFEWAIGKTFESGFIIGPVGYVYQQLSGDSGSGALLGSLKGRAIGLGGGIGYTGIIGGHMVVLSARQYFDVSSKNHLHGSASFISATVRF